LPTKHATGKYSLHFTQNRAFVGNAGSPATNSDAMWDARVEGRALGIIYWLVFQK